MISDDGSIIRPVAEDSTLAVLRVLFRDADKETRRQLAPILPRADVEFLGIRMRVDPRDNYTERRIWMDGFPPEMKCLTAAVELIEGRDAFVLDIGANCGAYTIPLALAVNAASRVVAVEPNPVMIGRLGHNILLNDLGGRIRIEGCALGASGGEAHLVRNNWNLGQHTIKTGGNGDKGHLVPVRSILDFAQEAARHDMFLVKIDVEGAEATVLGPLLNQDTGLPDAILVETRHRDVWDVDLIQKLTAKGYVATLEAEGNTLFVKR